jgi:hypothetical protein
MPLSDAWYGFRTPCRRDQLMRSSDARGERIDALKGAATRESGSGTESPTATVRRS